MAPSHTPQCIVSDQPLERIKARPSNIADIQHGNFNEVCWRECRCEGFCLFMTKNSSPPPPEYLWPALMGRFLIIRVIKEHNADGYQNYDKWQCPGTWTSLYTHSNHCYYIVLPVEQQFRNFTFLDLCKLSKLYFFCVASFLQAFKCCHRQPGCLHSGTCNLGQGPVFKGPILGRATFGPCTLSNPYPQLHTGSLANHHIFCKYGICGA